MSNVIIAQLCVESGVGWGLVGEQANIHKNPDGVGARIYRMQLIMVDRGLGWARC